MKDFKEINEDEKEDDIDEVLDEIDLDG